MEAQLKKARAQLHRSTRRCSHESERSERNRSNLDEHTGALANPKPTLHIVLKCIRQCLQVFFSLLSAALYLAFLPVFSLFFACSALFGGALWIIGRLVRPTKDNGKSH
ncbi:hypothetical protein ACFSHR_02535 [Azotobacter chroococcum]